MMPTLCVRCVTIFKVPSWLRHSTVIYFTIFKYSQSQQISISSSVVNLLFKKDYCSEVVQASLCTLPQVTYTIGVLTKIETSVSIISLI